MTDYHMYACTVIFIIRVHIYAKELQVRWLHVYIYFFKIYD